VISSYPMQPWLKMIKLAREGYLANTGDLEYEVDWDNAQQYGEEILELLWKHWPKDTQLKSISNRHTNIKKEEPIVDLNAIIETPELDTIQ
jgi:hypothetical protein